MNYTIQFTEEEFDPLTNRRNQIIYKGSDILYLDEALKSILDLD